MARIRAIKPEFAYDEELAKLPTEARLFYALLWTHMDRDGRGEDRPEMLRAKIYPYEPQFDVDKILSLLHPKFVVRYEVKGRRYLQVNNWNKHQRPHSTEAASVIPALDNAVLTQVQPLSNAGPTLWKGELGIGLRELGRERGRDITTAPSAVDLIKSAVRTNDRRVAQARLGDARLPFAFGDFPKGVRIIDLPVDTLKAIPEKLPRIGRGLESVIQEAIAQKSAGRRDA